MIAENINIIIADDNETFLEVLKLILAKNKKYNIIETCYNGEELLECKMLHKADLILCDIEMPVFDGIEATRRINFNYPKLPVIALTMHIEKIYLTDIIMAGFKGFIYKPEIKDKIHEVIEEVLNDNFIFPDNLKY